MHGESGRRGGPRAGGGGMRGRHGIPNDSSEEEEGMSVFSMEEMEHRRGGQRRGPRR